MALQRCSDGSGGCCGDVDSSWFAIPGSEEGMGCSSYFKQSMAFAREAILYWPPFVLNREKGFDGFWH